MKYSREGWATIGEMSAMQVAIEAERRRREQWSEGLSRWCNRWTNRRFLPDQLLMSDDELATLLGRLSVDGFVPKA